MPKSGTVQWRRAGSDRLDAAQYKQQVQWQNKGRSKGRLGSQNFARVVASSIVAFFVSVTRRQGFFAKGSFFVHLA
ncbi:hypothetical protein T4E_28 [Trichinella pseudospiralis]|uniref:Uncharacterized protein n=1 Tax=Trichinella pseudospiralis TaxID=6337 RepID=A0A0V0YCE9_TRIPS|nr:hypothetical protein T4E_28 [Trichinella pseudospiralis]